MPRRGGQSTHGGIRFQDWYGALLLARGFWDTEFVSLKTEAITDRNIAKVGSEDADGVDDLLLTYAHQRTAISCKQHAPSETGRWSLSQLDSAGVLSAFVAHYLQYPGDKLQLASMDPQHGNIREMQARLRYAVDSNINDKLGKQPLIDLFTDFKDRTSLLVDDSARLRFLSQLEFVQVQRDAAEKEIARLFSTQVANPDAIPSLLFAATSEWGEDGAAVDRSLMLNYLKARGFSIEVPSAARVHEAFDEASLVLASEDSSIPNVPDSEQPREVVDKVLQWLQRPKRKPEEGLAVVVGEAGAGKTAVLKMIYGALRAQGVPVLAFKADRVYEKTVGDLLQRLPAAARHLPSAIAALESNGHSTTVVLVDQLDALSQSLSANREFLYSYRDLLEQLLALPQVKVVVSCRAYDLQADPLLQSYGGRTKLEVGMLTEEQMLAVINASHLHGIELSPSLRELLRVPLHLRIFCQLSIGTELSEVRTLQGLYQALFKEKVLLQPAPRVQVQVLATRVKELLYRIAKRMYEQQQLSVQELRYADEHAQELDYVLSQKLIVRGTEGQLQFFHQSFFDYLYARQFVENDQRLATVLQSQSQGLFVRSSVRQVLSYARAADPRSYLLQIRELLNDAQHYRYHVRLLVCQHFAQIADPSAVEKSFARSTILNGAYHHQFLEAITHSGWVEWLQSEGFLASLFTQTTLGPGETALLRMLSRRHQRVLLNLLAEAPVDETSFPIAWHALRLLDDTCEVNYGEVFDRFGPLAEQKVASASLHMLGQRAKEEPEWVAAHLIRLFRPREGQWGENTKNHWRDQHTLEELYKANPAIGFGVSKELIEYWLEKTRVDRLPEYDYNNKYLIDDTTFSLTDVDDAQPSTISDMVLYLAYQYLRKLASTDVAAARQALGTWPSCAFDTLLILVAGTYRTSPKHFAQDAGLLLRRPGMLSEAGGWLKHQLVELMRVVLPELPSEEQLEIWKLVWQIPVELRWGHDERQADKREKEQQGRRVWIRLEEDRALYLSTFPESVLALVSEEERRSWFALYRKMGKPTNNKPIETGWRTGHPSPLPQSSVKHLRVSDWLKTFVKYQNPENERRWDDYAPGAAQLFKEAAKAYPELIIPVVDVLLEPEIEVKDSQFLLAGLEGLVEGKGIDREQFTEWLRTALKQGLIDPYDLEVVRLANHYIIHNQTSEFIWRWLIDATYACCEEIGGIRTNGEHDLSLNILNTSGGVAMRAIMYCTRMDGYNTVIQEVLQRVATSGSLTVRRAALQNLRLLLQTSIEEEAIFSLVVSLIGDNWKLFAYSSDIILGLSNYMWERVLMFLERAIVEPEAHKALTKILLIKWLWSQQDIYQSLERLWAASSVARETTIRFLMNEYEGMNQAQRVHVRSAFTSLLHYEDQELQSAYNAFFHVLTPKDFGDWYPTLQQFVQAVGGRGRERAFYDFLGSAVGRYPAECIHLVSAFDNHERPDITENGIEQKPLEVLLSAYQVLVEQDADAPELESTLDVFDALLQIAEYRNGVLNKLVELDRY